MQRSHWSFISAWHLMTPRDQWCYWDGKSRTSHLVAPGGRLRYEVIPVLEQDELVGVVRDTTFRVEPVTIQWCMSYDAPMDRLLLFFVQRDKPACFLLRGDRFVGLVTPADFNKVAARTAIYWLLAKLESGLIGVLRSAGFRESELLALLPQGRAARIRQHHATMAKNDVDVDLIESLYLSDIVQIASRKRRLFSVLGLTSRSEAERVLGGLVDLRNRVMHTNRPLLRNRRQDLLRLNERMDRLRGLLVKLDALNERDVE